ncbi:2335_t:CDS:1, partial [Gigaspora rosea]
MNSDSQNRILLLNIQTNSITQTRPGIYGPGNPHPNAFKKNPTLGGRQPLKRKKQNSQIINNIILPLVL